MRKGVSRIYKHPKASTLYVTIPSDLATDTIFPFRPGDEVEIAIDASRGVLELAPVHVRRKKGQRELEEYRKLARRIGESIITDRTPDEIIAKLRGKEY